MFQTLPNETQTQSIILVHNIIREPKTLRLVSVPKVYNIYFSKGRHRAPEDSGGGRLCRGHPLDPDLPRGCRMLSSSGSRLTYESKVFEPLTNENPGVRLLHPDAGDDEPDLQVRSGIVKSGLRN